MAGLRVLILGVLAVSCSAQFGYHPRFGDFTRQKQFQQSPRESPINQLLGKFGVPADDKKCFTVTRKPFYTNRLTQYPCFKRMEGVPILKTYMSPFGPMCISYLRERVYRPHKIQTCCPGYVMDKFGKCSIRSGLNDRPMFQPEFRRPLPNMIDMAARFRDKMVQRAKETMQQRRNMMLMNLNKMRQPLRPPFRLPFRQPFRLPFRPPFKTPFRASFMPPFRPPFKAPFREPFNAPFRPPFRPQFRLPSRPPMFPFMNLNKIRREPVRPKVAFLRFNKLDQPPKDRFLPRPPISRIIKIFKPRLFQGPMVMTFQKFPFQRNSFNGVQPNQEPNQEPPKQNPTRILSNRIPFSPFRRMPEYHPQVPQIPSNARAQPMYPDQSGMAKFPQIPEPTMSSTQYQSQGPQASQNELDQMHSQEGFNVPERQETQAPGNIQVNLPDQPIQMPDLVVEEGPLNQDNPNSCIAKLETAVQTCLKKNNVDVPNLMTAFEPFNDDISLLLCRAESAIFECIDNELKDCTHTNDAVVARDMLTETAETVRSMCELRVLSVPTDTQTAPEIQPAMSSTEGKKSETIATVESVDAIPVAEKRPETPAVVEEKPTVESKPTESMSSAQAMQEAIQHEVHVQEMRMKEYLLPILIGSGIGFFVLVLILSLMVCCCCKRKMKRKMKLIKELEKPPITDEIYTIGVDPPVYEVNGIPPMYYEEAKGEKISSKCASVQEGAETIPEADASQM